MSKKNKVTCKTGANFWMDFWSNWVGFWHAANLQNRAPVEARAWFLINFHFGDQHRFLTKQGITMVPKIHQKLTKIRSKTSPEANWTPNGPSRNPPQSPYTLVAKKDTTKIGAKNSQKRKSDPPTPFDRSHLGPRGEDKEGGNPPSRRKYATLYLRRTCSI